MSNSVRPHRQQPTRLPRPWDSPGKNTGVGCHFLLQCMKVKSEREVSQSCPTPSNPMDCSPPGSSIPCLGFSRQEYWSGVPLPTPEDLPDLGFQSLALAGGFFTTAPSGKLDSKVWLCDISLFSLNYSWKFWRSGAMFSIPVFVPLGDSFQVAVVGNGHKVAAFLHSQLCCCCCCC